MRAKQLIPESDRFTGRVFNVMSRSCSQALPGNMYSQLARHVNKELLPKSFRAERGIWPATRERMESRFLAPLGMTAAGALNMYLSGKTLPSRLCLGWSKVL